VKNNYQKKKIFMPRLPKEAIEILKKKGGPHIPKKGGKYDRAREKQKKIKEIKRV
jgi:hypothetical protein